MVKKERIEVTAEIVGLYRTGRAIFDILDGPEYVQKLLPGKRYKITFEEVE